MINATLETKWLPGVCYDILLYVPIYHTIKYILRAQAHNGLRALKRHMGYVYLHERRGPMCVCMFICMYIQIYMYMYIDVYIYDIDIYIYRERERKR